MYQCRCSSCTRGRRLRKSAATVVLVAGVLVFVAWLYVTDAL
jgi:hypothetical protein